MKVVNYKDAGFDEFLSSLCNRSAFPPEAEKSAAAIIADVRERGDAAIIEYAKKFDHVELTPDKFKVTPLEIKNAIMSLNESDKRAIRMAAKNIMEFAKLTKPKSWKKLARPGVTLGERFSPFDRVGVYIPGGTAPLVSTVLHTAGIAHAVGVKSIVAVTPPGNIPPATLFAMKIAGVTEVYRLGGVYGVAALAVGTQTIKKVQKIAGLGNAYVTAAKKLLYGEVGIDLVAGPSEILVVADNTADPRFIAADLLSQAEHGSGLEQSVLATDSAELIAAVKREVTRQKALLSREDIIDRVLDNGTFMIQFKDINSAAKFAGQYAPEHLEIQTATPSATARKIVAAGAMFLGPWTPEPIGDFCAGPSHVLPTASSALRFNGLESASFMRRTSIVSYTKAAVRREINIVRRFGAMEQLDAHARSGTIRSEELHPLIDKLNKKAAKSKSKR